LPIGGSIPKIVLGKKTKTNSSPSSTEANESSGSGKKYSAAEKTKILDKTNYPDYDKDFAYVDKLYFNSSSFSFTGNNFKTDSTTYIQAQQTKKEFELIKEKYTEYWDVYKSENMRDDAIQDRYKGVNRKIIDFETTINNYANYASTAVPEYLEKAKTAYEECKTSGSLKDGFGNNRQKEIYPHFIYAEYYLNVLKLVKGDSNAAYIEVNNKYKTSKTEITSGVNKLELDLLAKKVAPIDKYKGADKEKHRAAVIKMYNESTSQNNCRSGKVLKVYFTDDQWNRKTGIDWNNNGQSYDNSFLNVAIVVSDYENPEKANVLYSYVVKDNLNAGKLDYAYCSCGIQTNYSMLVINIGGK
jgi:hypothetical protein